MSTIPSIHIECAIMCKEVYTKKNHIQVRYNKKHNSLILAVEGTYCWYDWLDNFAVCKQNDIHRGFRKHATHIKQKYHLSKVFSKYKNSKIYLCGHSLGAASVALISYDYQKMYDIETVLFGTPRIGGEHFKQLFKSVLANKVYEYQIQSDIVPRLPFTFMGYKSWDNPISLHPVSHPFKIIDNHCIQSYIDEMNILYHNQQHEEDVKKE